VNGVVAHRDKNVERATRDAAPASDFSLIKAAHVRQQLIALLFQRGRNTVAAGLAVGILSLVYLWGKVPTVPLLSWFVLMCLIAVLRFGLIERYRRAAPPTEAAPQWGRYYTVMAGVTGLLWAAGGLALILWAPPEPALTLFAAMVLGGISVGSILALASHLPASYAFIGPLLFAVIFGFSLRGDELSLTLAGMGVAFLAINVLYTHDARRSIAESIALRFENLNLIDELKRQRAEAEAANIAKSKFLAAASHDLRQPLHALILFVSALDERIRYPEVRAIVDNIGGSVQALEKLFASLLDISRLDAGVIQPQVRDFRLQDLFERLRTDYAAEAAQKEVAFRCLPTDAAVRSDPQLLERILRNYLSNAMRYTEAGTVELRSEVRDGEVIVAVADTGKGIPRDRQREIFHEFYQLENPERDRTKGLGLGLAIVDRLAKLLGHTIHVESAPGRGSVFSVRVPTGDAVAAARSSASAAHMPTSTLAGLRVLVIDDELSVRQGMQTLLAQWGCDVLLAGSEEEAIALLQNARGAPDAVIADYRLREHKTGAATIRRIQAEYGESIAGLIITGDTAPDRLREAATSGCELLHKPVAPAQLRAFLTDVRNRRKAAQVAEG
jgi:two-component system, sensor histidine kinase